MYIDMARTERLKRTMTTTHWTCYSRRCVVLCWVRWLGNWFSTSALNCNIDFAILGGCGWGAVEAVPTYLILWELRRGVKKRKEMFLTAVQPSIFGANEEHLLWEFILIGFLIGKSAEAKHAVVSHHDLSGHQRTSWILWIIQPTPWRSREMVWGYCGMAWDRNSFSWQY